jgi:hypothetical protein
MIYALLLVYLLFYFLYRSVCQSAKDYIGGDISDANVRFRQFVLSRLDSPPFTCSLENFDMEYPYGSYELVYSLCHIGQRKLLMNELQFLTNYFSDNFDFVIYAGAAPSEHLPVLLDLFPRVRFLLIDPNYIMFSTKSNSTRYSFRCIYQNFNLGNLNAHYNDYIATRDFRSIKKVDAHYDASSVDMTEFAVSQKTNTFHTQFNETNEPGFFGDGPMGIFRDGHRVAVIQDYLSLDLAKKLKEYKHIHQYKFLYISDLRTNFFKSDGPTDMDILANDCLNMSFIHIVRPKFSMIKFRAPYYDSFSIQVFETIRTAYSHQWNMLAEAIEYMQNIFKQDFVAFYLAQKNLSQRMYPFVKYETIWLQPWGPYGSTEARMVVALESIEQQIHIDSTQWENKYLCLRYIRQYAYYSQYETFRSLLNPLFQHGYDGCLDCTIELTIVSQYLLRFLWKMGNEDIRDIQQACTLINRRELTDTHKQAIVQFLKTLNKDVYPIANNVRNHGSNCHFHGYLDKKLNPIFYQFDKQTVFKIINDRIVETIPIMHLKRENTMFFKWNNEMKGHPALDKAVLRKLLTRLK